MILAIDPGPTESAYVVYDGERPRLFGKKPNAEVMEIVRMRGENNDGSNDLVIEMIASYGMAVGAEVFQTCVFIGRIAQAWADAPRTHGVEHPQSYALVYRRDVKLHLCGSARAKDGNVRQALIDKYGGKDKAIGKKATPGPLYGVTADVWSALAVAVTYAAQRQHATSSHSLPHTASGDSDVESGGVNSTRSEGSV